jgi:lantibiotic modifying enzyme
MKIVNKVVIILFVSIMITQVATPVQPPRGKAYLKKNIYFEYALKAASWLMSLAVEESPDVYKWPVSEETPTSFLIGMGSGAAGIGTFFLEIYRTTGEDEYLRYAEGAAKFITEQDYEDVPIDWLAGPGGAGSFLLELSKTTHNIFYLNQAIRLGDWLITQHFEENTGYYWIPYSNAPDKIFTGWAHGVAGLGAFFIELYGETGDETYLDYAEGAARWILSVTQEPNPGHYCWPRLVTDSKPNTSWCGGSVGILMFLLKMYESTGRGFYWNYCEGGVDWLIYEASISGINSIHWGESHAYCHGTPSVVHLLYLMSQHKNDPKYLEYARKGARWLEEEAEWRSNSVYRWTHFLYHDTGLLTGTAGVGNSFVLYSGFEDDVGYLDYARGAAHWLISVAEYDGFDKTKWFNYIEEVDEDYGKKEHETGWYNGAAGIGLFFLRLSQALPLPPETNSSPTLNPIGEKKAIEGTRLEFDVYGIDPDGDPLVFLAAGLPAEAAVIDKRFIWEIPKGMAGTFSCYFIITDGWEMDWEKVTIHVKRVKNSRVRR